jgi:modulator of FtsH protease HflC
VRRLFFVCLVTVAVFAGLVWLGNIDRGPFLITREDQQKIVLLFGKPLLVRTEPGLALRLPLVTDVLTYDKRRLYLSTEPITAQTRDQEQLVIDNYVIWRIEDPVQYRSSFPLGRGAAEAQINQVVNNDLREVIGQRTFSEVVTTSRVEVMQAITHKSDENLRASGIRIEDVRINRTELPAPTEENVYARMRTERERLARKERAEGEQEGRTIRAQADRESQVIVAEAKRDAEVERGQGDADATRIFAEAYSADPDFYSFVRGLEAYRKAIGPRTTLVLSPSSEFFRLLDSAKEPKGP